MYIYICIYCHTYYCTIDTTVISWIYIYISNDGLLCIWSSILLIATSAVTSTASQRQSNSGQKRRFPSSPQINQNLRTQTAQDMPTISNSFRSRKLHSGGRQKRRDVRNGNFLPSHKQTSRRGCDTCSLIPRIMGKWHLDAVFKTISKHCQEIFIRRYNIQLLDLPPPFCAISFGYTSKVSKMRCQRTHYLGPPWSC